MAKSANLLIAAVASDHLAPLGLIRKGRSRTWIDDHGWWLINVEFQPSSGRVGCYLNIGDQHLWVVRPHLTFDGMERPVGAAAFVAFNGDEEAFAQSMAHVAKVAIEAIRRRRDAHGDGIKALKRLTDRGDDLNAGIAAALRGDQEAARLRLARHIHDADRSVADSYVGVSASVARAQAEGAIAESRTLLQLRPAQADWW